MADLALIGPVIGPVIGGLTLLLLLAFVLPRLLLRKSRAEQTELRNHLLQIVGPIILTLTLLVTFFQFQIAQHSVAQQIQLTRSGQITDRYSHASDQLSSNQPYVRLAGIDALEQIANEAADQPPTTDTGTSIRTLRLSAFNILAAFVRTPPPDSTANRAGPREDVQLAMNVLARRVQRDDDPSLDLTGADLRGMSIEYQAPSSDTHHRPNQRDLRRVKLAASHLEGATFTNVNFDGANLKGASFDQKSNFNGSILSNTCLAGDQFNGADFTSTTFSYARLNFAVLELKPPKGQQPPSALAPTFDFTGALLLGADLQPIGLQDLNHAHLSKAYYNQATRFPAGFNPSVAQMIDTASEDEFRKAIHFEPDPSACPPR